MEELELSEVLAGFGVDLLGPPFQLVLRRHIADSAVQPHLVVMADELGQDETWERGQVAAFTEMAQSYLIDRKTVS